MRWLVTGGCGFIGHSFVKFLKARDETDIRVVDNLSVGCREDLASAGPFRELSSDDLSPDGPEGTELVVGDIKDEVLALQLAQGTDVIVHFAGNTGVQPSLENPRLDCMSNVIGTLNYLEAARLNKVQRFVFASSGGTVIGDCEPPIHEEMVPHPKSPYGASKSACEGYLSAYHGSFGLETVALRFSNVYGPGSSHKNSVVAKFIRQALAGETLEIYGSGKQTRDFIYLDDLLEAVYLAATVDNVGGEVFQIATSQETTVQKLSERLVGRLEATGVRPVELVHAAPLPGEIKRNYSDTSKALARLGWRAQTELDEGLAKTVHWFLGQQT